MLSSPRILIVDDEPRICESLKDLLSTQDYEVQTAASGREALEALSKGEFDVVLLDLVMPDINGNEVLESINEKKLDAFVIVLTGDATLESAVGALRGGAHDFIRKPFEWDELQRRVKNAVDQKRLKSENVSINGKLALSEERYEFLVQNSPDIIYTLDDQNNFTFVSKAAERLLGFKAEQLVGTHYSTIILDEDLEKAKWSFNERRTGGRAVSGIELRLKVTANGNKFENRGARHLAVELKSTGLYNRPRPGETKEFLGTHGVARDINERKLLESQLRQAQKMEAIGTLAGGIAHDFNNLLMAIQGNASLMLLETEPEKLHHERLKNIEAYVRSGADLTRQLLGFARGGKYEVKPTDINEIIKKSSEMFGRTKKEIIIHGKYEENIWPADVDQGQIEQVLLNLYVNAWQAMPGGGELYLQTENVTLDKQDVKPFDLGPGRYVKISVTDTGVGMDKSILERIFDPFFTTKEMGRGTGLGLASAYGIIKNHGGVIDVSSSLGAGAVFQIYLPASEKTILPETSYPKESVKGKGTILLVDDEEMIVNIGKEMLKKFGYDVLIAKGGKEAIKIYESNKDQIDLIILDMVMPDMGGGEVFDHLKETKPEIKVLLSSGYSVEGEGAQILDRGCDGFIQKPFDMKRLIEKINEILHPE